MKIAFIHVTAIPEMPWGFGNIQVNNERLKETYRVGANGAFQIKITDFTKLMGAFSGSCEITVDDVKEKVTTLIKTIGTEVVGGCFANTDVSVFEISSLVGKLREDIEKFQTEILKKMSEEIAAAEARSKDASERKITEQIENNRRATVSTVMQYINEQLDKFGKRNSTLSLQKRELRKKNIYCPRSNSIKRTAYTQMRDEEIGYEKIYAFCFKFCFCGCRRNRDRRLHSGPHSRL